MKINIENIGIISDANIAINGISLIAGPNDSGKSTVGKILYSLIRGLNPNETVFFSEKNDSIRSLYQNVLKIIRDNKDINVAEFQTSKINDEWVESVLEKIDKFEGTQAKQLRLYCTILRSQIKIEYDSISHKNSELYRYFTEEFNDEFISVFNDNLIPRIYLEDLEGTATIDLASYPALNNNINLFYDNVYFIETPSIVDKTLQESIIFEEPFSRKKNIHLKYALANESSFLFSEKDLQNSNTKVIDIISNIINGQFIVDDFKGVIYEKNGKEIDIDNVAQGIKGFGLIQLLLKNKQLNPRTLLIIDEPEIHLHPTWQILYAEILTILSKKLDIPILLTSHSPYFIEALKAYTEKYNFNDKTNFYISKKSKNGLSSSIYDVSNDISPILTLISEAYFKITDIENE